MECDSINIRWARRHRNYKPHLLEKVKKQDPNLVKAKATPEARKLANMQSQVARAYDKTRSFARLNVSKHGIIWSEIVSEHRILDLIFHHFRRRYPTFHVVLGGNEGTYVGTPSGKTEIRPLPVSEVVKALEKKLPPNELICGLEFEQQLWISFYKSQCISERANLKLMNQMMPKKYREKGALEDTIVKKCAKICDYM